MHISKLDAALRQLEGERFGTEVSVECDVPVPMRDGCVLRADVFRPELSTPLPVLLLRTPYDKRIAQSAIYRPPEWYAARGYIVAVQDVRGRYASEGAFAPFAQERLDGLDTLEWAASLQESTGGVGTYGFSYAGTSQLYVAGHSRHLRCLAPASAPAELHAHWFYRHGALRWAFVVSWAVDGLAVPDALRSGDTDRAARLDRFIAQHPLTSWSHPARILDEIGADLPAYVLEWLEHPADDPYWQRLAPPLSPGGDSPASLHMTGWYDTFLEGTLDAFDRLAGSEPARPQEGRARLVIGPWTHSPWGSRAGQRSFGPEAALSVDELHVRWFDRWLKDRRGDQAEGTIRYFEMGSGRWREDDTWPPRAMRHESWYLHSAGAANTSDGDGELVRGLPQDDPPDMIVHDPGSPVPSLGGSSCCDERLAPMGSYDQSPIQHRPDVLVYISEALAEEIEIAGQVRARLFYRSSRPALDWVATLAVATPSGEVYNLCDGIWRSNAAEGSERDLEHVSDERVAEVDLGNIADRFAKGERICLQIAGSSFPAYGVNPGPGLAHPLEWPVGTPSTQMLFHDVGRPSAIELPVVFREDPRS